MDKQVATFINMNHSVICKPAPQGTSRDFGQMERRRTNSECASQPSPVSEVCRAPKALIPRGIRAETFAQGGRQSSLPCPATPTHPHRSRQTLPRKTTYRLVVLGAAGVGKTAIINRFLYEKFISDYQATVDELHRGEYNVSGCYLTLDIHDTSGAYAFPAMRRLSITTGDAFILVYSLQDKDSLQEVRALREQIVEAKGPCAPIVVVANKTDTVKTEGSTKHAPKEAIDELWGHRLVQASAREDINIVGIFKELVLQLDQAIGDAFSPGIRKRCLTPAHGKSETGKRKAKVVKQRSCQIS